jgi:hypothetical protein
LAFLDEGAAYQDLAELLLVEVAEGAIEGVSEPWRWEHSETGRN